MQINSFYLAPLNRIDRTLYSGKQAEYIFGIHYYAVQYIFSLNYFLSRFLLFKKMFGKINFCISQTE